MSNDLYNPELNITNYVGKFSEMDPKTEDLIADGCDLKNGMRVLIADPFCREDVSHGFNTLILGLDEGKLNRAKEKNRWCTVSQLSYSGDIVSFVAIYDDDTKRKRTYKCSWAWLVKLDSMPKTDENGDELGNEKGCCINCWYSISKTCGDELCVCHDPARNNR